MQTAPLFVWVALTTVCVVPSFCRAFMEPVALILAIYHAWLLYTVGLLCIAVVYGNHWRHGSAAIHAWSSIDPATYLQTDHSDVSLSGPEVYQS